MATGHETIVRKIRADRASLCRRIVVLVDASRFAGVGYDVAGSVGGDDQVPSRCAAVPQLDMAAWYFASRPVMC